MARPHPDRANAWQLLDGHQHLAALQELGRADALVFPWPCGDAEALLLLATLNRLEGADQPAQRAALLGALAQVWSPPELALLVPEEADAITTLLAFGARDIDALVAELDVAAATVTADLPTPITFAVEPADVAIVEQAVATAMAARTGPNRRGRAIGSCPSAPAASAAAIAAGS